VSLRFVCFLFFLIPPFLLAFSAVASAIAKKQFDSVALLINKFVPFSSPLPLSYFYCFLVRLSLEDLQGRTDNGLTLLSLAVRQGNVDLVSALLKKGPFRSLL
jgi:ankyrin repeat protein